MLDMEYQCELRSILLFTFRLYDRCSPSTKETFEYYLASEIIINWKKDDIDIEMPVASCVIRHSSGRWAIRLWNPLFPLKKRSCYTVSWVQPVSPTH